MNYRTLSIRISIYISVLVKGYDCLEGYTYLTKAREKVEGLQD